jgi:hypothetical protein
MTPADMEAHIVRLTAANMAHRRITARLLTYVSMLEKDPEAMLKEFSDDGDWQADLLGSEMANNLDLAEQVRLEKDWMIGFARSLNRDKRQGR